MYQVVNLVKYVEISPTDISPTDSQPSLATHIPNIYLGLLADCISACNSKLRKDNASLLPQKPRETVIMPLYFATHQYCSNPSRRLRILSLRLLFSGQFRYQPRIAVVDLSRLKCLIDESIVKGLNHGATKDFREFNLRTVAKIQLIGSDRLHTYRSADFVLAFDVVPSNDLLEYQIVNSSAQQPKIVLGKEFIEHPQISDIIDRLNVDPKQNALVIRLQKQFCLSLST